MVAEELTRRASPWSSWTAEAALRLDLGLDGAAAIRHRHPLTLLAKTIGAEDAARAWRRSKLGSKVSRPDRGPGLQSRFRPPPLGLSHWRRSRRDGLRAEQIARRRHRPAYANSSRRKCSGSIRHPPPAALDVADSVAVNRRSWRRADLLKAIERARECYAPVTVDTVRATARGVDVVTAEGPSIKAGM